MFEETRYGYEVFNMHVRGVDVVMIIMYLHILKKFFLKNYITYDSEGWLIGNTKTLTYKNKEFICFDTKPIKCHCISHIDLNQLNLLNI